MLEELEQMDRPQLTVLEGGLAPKETNPSSVELPPLGDNPEFEVGYSEELPDLVPEDAQPKEEINFQNVAMQVAFRIQQIVQSGDDVVMLLAGPDYAAGLSVALQELPDEAYPQALKERLQVAEAPDMPGVQIITHSDIERQFLERYYGERTMGGTGFIPTLSKYLQDNGFPVRITVEFLRAKFLQEMADRCVPNIIVPSGATLRQGIPTR